MAETAGGAGLGGGVGGTTPTLIGCARHGDEEVVEGAALCDYGTTVLRRDTIKKQSINQSEKNPLCFAITLSWRFSIRHTHTHTHTFRSVTVVAHRHENSVKTR